MPTDDREFRIGKVTFVPANEQTTRISEKWARSLVAYTHYLLQVLDLPEWRVALHEYPCADEKATMSCNVHRTNRTASMWFGDDFFNSRLSDFHRTQSMIHECLHINLGDGWNFIEDMINNELSEQTKKVVEHVFDNYMEIATDRLAWAFSELVEPFRSPGKGPMIE